MPNTPKEKFIAEKENEFDEMLGYMESHFGVNERPRFIQVLKEAIEVGWDEGHGDGVQQVMRRTKDLREAWDKAHPDVDYLPDYRAVIDWAIEQQSQSLLHTLIAEVEKRYESSVLDLAGETTPEEMKLGHGYRIALREVSALLTSHLPAGDSTKEL